MSEQHPEGRTLPPFPVDDFTLDQLEHALNTCIEITDDGERKPHGGDFTLNRFLEFMSGYDPDRCSFMGYLPGPFGDLTEWYEDWDQHYSESDVIRALVAEVRRLRGASRAH